MGTRPQLLITAARLLENAVAQPSVARQIGQVLEEVVLESLRFVLNGEPMKLYRGIQRSVFPYLFVIGFAQSSGHTGLTSNDVGHVLRKSAHTVRRNLRDSPLCFLIHEFIDETDRRRRLYRISKPLHGRLVPPEFEEVVARTAATLRELGVWDPIVLQNMIIGELRTSMTRERLDRYLIAVEAAIEDILAWGQSLRRLMEEEYGDLQAAHNLLSFLKPLNDLRPLLSDGAWRGHLADQLSVTAALWLDAIQDASFVQIPDESIIQVSLACLAHAIANGEQDGKDTTPTRGSHR